MALELSPAPIDAVQLGGVLGEALTANLEGRLSHFIIDEHSPAIAIFAPDAVAANVDGDWYGEHAGKWLIAAARAAVRHGDRQLLDRVRHVADHLVGLQGEDGYLGNYPPARRFTTKQPPKAVTWDGAPARRTWDIWTHSYLILGLLTVHRALGGTRYLEAARRIGDLCWQALTEGGINIVDLGRHFGLSATILIDPAVELHMATGERRYLELAVLVLEQAEHESRNRLLSGALAGLDVAEIATGKIYQLLWNLVGIAKLYRVTADQRYLDAVRNLWRAVRERHLTLGGGPWGGVALRSREIFNSADFFSPEGYVETCSTMAWIQLNGELLGILGDAAFAQEIERSAYNDLLGAQAPNGQDWCYYSFPNGKRTHTTYWRCCKSSGAMALEELPSLAYSVTRAGGIAVNLLGPSTARLKVPGGAEVVLHQQTAYPFHGAIHIAVDTAAEEPFEIRIRIPDWAHDPALAVNGAARPAVAGEYAVLHRHWKSGDVITLTLPMAPVVHRAIRNNVQESIAPGGVPVEQEVMRYEYVAVSKGPLTYATGLIDGYKHSETLRFDGPPQVDVEGDRLILHSSGRSPIVFEPYYRVGGRSDGTWRLTWMDVA